MADWAPYINFGILVLVLIAIYYIVVEFVIRAIKYKDFPRDVLNGIKLLLKIIIIFVIVVYFFSVINLPPEFLLTVSSVSGIIVGFASTEVISQVVSGIYLISSQPFGVWDLVNISGTEGIVTEIGINYTTIEQFNGVVVKIPNQTVVNSNIQNFTYQIPKEYMEQSTAFLSKLLKIKKREESKPIPPKLREILEDLDEPIKDPEITRYVFSINISSQ